MVERSNKPLKDMCLEGIDCQNYECKEWHPKFLTQFCLQYLLQNCLKTDCYKEHKSFQDLQQNISEGQFDEYEWQNQQEVYDNDDSEYDSDYGEYDGEDNHDEENKENLQFLEDFKQFIDTSKQEILYKTSSSDLMCLQLQFARTKKSPPNVNLLIILDTTGSMSGWIEEMKQKCIVLINSLRDMLLGKGQILKVGFIGYKDIGDSQNLEYENFTEHYDKIKDIINNQYAGGGGDIPEDLLGALELGLNFDYHNKDLTCVVLFTDAPCHGKQYHTFKDDYPDEGKGERLEKILDQYKTKKGDVFFYCVKLTNNTDQMFGIMKQNLDCIQILDSKTPFDFQTIVQNSVLKSCLFRDTIIRTKINPQTLIKDYDQIFEEIKTVPEMQFAVSASRITVKLQNLKQEPKQMNYQYWLELKNHIKQNLIQQQKLQLQIQHTPHQEGSEYRVYTGNDQEFGQVVLKFPKFRTETNEEQKEIAHNKFIQQYYSCMMAKYFRKVTVLLDHAPVLFYLQPILYVLEKPLFGTRIIYAEKMIQDDDIKFNQFTEEYFVKHTNNAQYCSNDLIAAFSHFTFDASEELFMITDLQGRGTLLTDPAIQSKHSIFKANTNRGLHGIIDYFALQHTKCSNEICKKLGLKCPIFLKQRFEDSLEVKADDNQIMMLCEKCCKFKKYSKKQYQDQLQGFIIDNVCFECINENEDNIQV